MAAAIIICLMMTTFSVMLMILIFLPFYEYILTTLEDFFTYSLFVSRKAGGFPLLLLLLLLAAVDLSESLFRNLGFLVKLIV